MLALLSLIYDNNTQCAQQTPWNS